MASTHADHSDAAPANFIIFGEMGAGKSSLVNLIAGKQLATASSGAISCTLDSTQHNIRLPDSQCEVNLYDTAGLNEPSMNNATYIDAAAKAYELILSLQENGGIHGLIFCIRGGRISDTVQKNYSLFYEVLCQKQVPISLVFTGLENEPDDMDNWWTQNQVHVEKSGIASVAHVCITTIKGYNNVYEKRYLESRKKVLKMLNELVCGTACPVDAHSWCARVFQKLRQLLAPGKVPWVVGKSQAKLMQVLVKRCKLRKEDAKELLRRMEEKV
ncbi:hypothetical protein K503DRAFT_771279 [Rhizopogon vinicolor AM-OR11-026]|uniref:G domain-containing protein n=1 Tax=Rhizopogon vinicolor AM-OR11-026 TaxID=1314800 RepID=A0A1B7MYH6_9AGAM|nr:hypothetical protein K503DRAFT_771279 [Rhizopogon vinicolor AM-OR11-026]